MNKNAMEARTINHFVGFTMTDVEMEISYLESVAFNKKSSPANRTRANQELVVLQGMEKYFLAAEEEDIDLDDVSFYELMSAVVGEDKINEMLAPSIMSAAKGVVTKAKDATVSKGRGFMEGLGDFFYAASGRKTKE